MQNQTVTTIEEFKRKYGNVGWRLLIDEFIRRSPRFKGDTELAQGIGEVCADLQSALANVPFNK